MSGAEAPLPLLKSLRARGLVATLALLAYLLGAGLYIAAERNSIVGSMEALERLAQHEKALALTEAAVSSALVDASEASNAGQGEPTPVAELALYMESCSKLFEQLSAHDPGSVRLYRAIERSYGALREQPVRASWIDLRESLRRASDELEIRRSQLTEQREQLSTGFYRQYDAVTAESLLLAALGLVVFGALAAWFFARLAGDVRRLQQHALAIVRGTRGVALQVQREDELGRLMHAVNRMSTDLDEREKQLQLDAQQRSHQDKMMAVGALAAGVAHEVNNPLAVISGVAEELRDTQSPPSPERLAEGAQLILAQAQRAGQAARQLAEVASPQPAELDWVDLNALLRQVVQLLGYDKRYRRLHFEVQTDTGLPAVRSSPRALQQVLMQLLSLVCDALASREGGAGELQLQTSTADGGLLLQVVFPPVLDFARAEVQRSLLLSRAIVEPLRGRLAFGQVDGAGQRIQLTVPADAGGEPG